MIKLVHCTAIKDYNARVRSYTKKGIAELNANAGGPGIPASSITPKSQIFTEDDLYVDVFDKKVALLFVIQQDESDEVLGFIEVRHEPSPPSMTRIATVWIRPEFRRKGVAFEALTSMIGLIRIRFRPVNITIGVASRNIAAYKLYQKLGFESYHTVMRIPK